MVELSPGEFIYQSDQELFLVVIEENEDSYLFAAHGWRDIGKDRIEQYLDDSKSKIHRQSEIEKLVEDKGDDETKAHFNKLKELFETYEETELIEDGPQSDFTLEDQ